MKSGASRSRNRSAARVRRGAALYSVVMFNSLIAGLLGLSALAVVRTERRQSTASTDVLAARKNAESAVAAALALIKSNTSWRSTYTHNLESAPLSFARGTSTWKLVDTTDSSLADDPRDSVLIQGIGRVGEAVWVESVEAQQPDIPLPSLATALHTEGRLRVDAGKTLTVLTGEASTDGQLELNGAIVGSVACQTLTGNVHGYTGSATIAGPLKENPPSTLFNKYKDLARQLVYSGDMNRVLLTPASNGYSSGTNAEGVYYIDTGGATLSINSSRIHGTLVIKGNVIIDGSVFLHTYRPDYPALIVDGNLTLRSNSSTFLSEQDASRNFNPAGSPFAGGVDGDEADVYPDEIWGVVHARGTVTIDGSTHIFGVLLAEGDVTVKESCSIQRDTVLSYRPPDGYVKAVPDVLKLKDNRWDRGVAP